jgi:hypothetical protein
MMTASNGIFAMSLAKSLKSLLTLLMTMSERPVFN